jgi:CRP/FNR family transcriptional regulator, cyclic AMP receptor protein
MQKISGKYLQETTSLSLFPLTTLNSLAAKLALRTFERKQIIFDQERKAESVFILLTGVVQIDYLNHDRQTVVALVPQGELFGLEALALNVRYPFRAVAFEKTTVAAINGRSLVESLLGVTYDTYLQWYRITSEPQRNMHVHCIKGIGLDLRKRLALELLHLAERFGKPHRRGLQIDLKISHELLAAIVGASRQQVTEYLNHFDREKIISREGRRIIVDQANLLDNLVLNEE